MLAPDGATWTAEKARAEALQLLGRIRAGCDPLEERQRADEERRRRRPTVAEVCEEWLQRDQAGNRSAAEVRRNMERDVLPVIGGMPFDELRKADVLRLVEDIAGRAPVMANRTFARLRRMGRWAPAREPIERDPTAGLEPPAREKSRDRVLDDGELVPVWRAAERIGWPFGAIVRLLIPTGCRRDEIGALRWDEVKDLDGPAPRILLEGARTRTDEARSVPLSEPAAAILRGLPRFAGGDFVFGTAGRRPFRGWSRAKRRLDGLCAEIAGGPLRDWRLHDLRRTCATGLQKLGVRLEVTEAVLGHVSGSRAGIVGVYQRHRYEAEKRQALDLWARHLLGLLESHEGVVLPFVRRWMNAGRG
jgi:integrase